MSQILVPSMLLVKTKSKMKRKQMSEFYYKIIYMELAHENKMMHL